MQSQGLGALMPQAAQQMAPQQASPRLTAATNLVSSDAERQILDPRTLALIKYKDALQAMQAADQMMAAAQPAPTPPTVAERTKLAAEQGIAGLASKLGAGIQQQGNRMQAQQAQQAMSGGLPQLPAPNMAGMAQGGIVGYQEGGDVSQREALIAQFIQSGMDPLAAAEEAARALGLTPQVLSTTYGAGDRTGQGENLRGMAEGVASLIGDRARSATPRMPEMSEEELLALTTSEGGGRRSRLPEMSEEELLALTTSEGSGEAPKPDRSDRLSISDRTDALKETLGRDLAGIKAFIAPPQGFGVRPEPRNIFARGETQAEAPEDAPATESGGASVGRLATPELEQIEAEIESDPNAFEQLASWVAENPYDAVSMGLIAIPGIGLAGGLGMRGVSALLRSPAVRRAVQSLYSRPNPRFASVGPNLPGTAARVAAPGRAISVGSGVVGTGMMVPGMINGDGSGESLASIPLGPTATQTVGTSRVRPAQQGFTPAPEGMSGEMREPTPVERLRAAAAENTAQQGGKDAVDALLEEEQQPRAGESASDRDARMRRLIAGLRGFGAQGLGGFAAGAGEEELRQEQEGIAEQERKRRAGMEDRELSLKDREVTLMDQIRRQQLDADIRQRAEQALLRMEALGSAERQFVQEQIGERTSNIDQLIQNFNLSLISGNVRGRDADALRNQILALQEQKANIMEEALINLEQPDRSGAIRALEEAAYGTGAGGLTSDEDALVNSYLGN